MRKAKKGSATAEKETLEDAVNSKRWARKGPRVCLKRVDE